MYRVILSLLFIFLVSGCSKNLQPALPENFVIDACVSSLTELQQLNLRYTGIQQGEIVAGAPWLRSNRLVDYYIRQNNLSEKQLTDLLGYMSRLAITGLQQELLLLPVSQLQQWKQRFKITTDSARYINDCSQTLVQQQILSPSQSRRFLLSLPEDDDYQPFARIAGIYPITALLFKQGVMREHTWLYQQTTALQNSDWNTYGPINPKTLAPNLLDIPRDSLGIPNLSPATEQALIEHHAPLWRLPDNLAVNRPGHPYWDKGSLKVDQQPISFSYISHGIHRSQTTLQLNYLIWFPERIPESRFDLLAGQHDAVLFRVHLTQAGQILAYDSIHLCGCWYSLILPHAQRYSETRQLYREPTFVLRTEPGRQLLSLTSNSHLLIASQKAEALASVQKQYQLRPFNDLLQLQVSTSPRLRSSVFNPEGFVPGSERPERWLFWPMGISNPGALRRPGDHAIRFIGKLHFDDPLILERLGVGKDSSDLK
ncbi:MAG: hypothetical protein KBT54_09500 [Amphritea sp.]|nr:hypothetical protein [Amphritea sp.]